MLVRVKVERVTLDTATSRFVVILKDMNQNRWLPIVVGSTEAQAIALQLENISPPRPLTHDLVKNLLESLNVTVSGVKDSEGQLEGMVIDPPVTFYNEIHNNTQVMVYPGLNFGLQF